MNSNKFVALIPCAGVGSRFGGDVPKQYVKLINDRTILENTLTAFINHQDISVIVVVVGSNDTYIDAISDRINSDKLLVLRVGGATRFDTVKNGLNHLSLLSSDWVLVHDAVRCFISQELIDRLITQLKDDEIGGILAIPATDTIKYVDNGIIQKTIDREYVYLAQTPQMFRYGVLKESINQIDSNYITDEASILEACGKQVKIVLGASSNIKITNSSDIFIR